ncbi:Ion channel regulatory protein [Aphelenchoides avenae]|nr:Ion channel regulatory protein [Aphelenchus avenae]
MALLLVVFVYSGIEMSFWSGIYPTCIAFTRNLENPDPPVVLALSSICIGLGQLLANIVIYFVAACRDKRVLVVMLATIIHLLVFAAVPIWFPLRSTMEETTDVDVLEPHVAVALTCAFMMGFADASWNTQISACLLEYFPTKGLQAFSLFNFFQSLATSATFVYGGYLPLHYHSLILALLAACACVCFASAERLHDLRSQSLKDDD